MEAFMEYGRTFSKCKISQLINCIKSNIYKENLYKVEANKTHTTVAYIALRSNR